jgi:hypothetical protein
MSDLINTSQSATPLTTAPFSAYQRTPRSLFPAFLCELCAFARFKYVSLNSDPVAIADHNF